MSEHAEDELSDQPATNDDSADRDTDAPSPIALARPARALAGPLAALIAFFVLLAGLFVLPLNTYPFDGADLGYVEVRSFAAVVSGRAATAFVPFSTLASFWWQYGVLIIIVILALMVVIALMITDTRPIGTIIAVLSVAGGVLQGFALAQTTDLRSGAQVLVGYGQTNVYDNAGTGVWVSLAGFLLLAAAGVLLAVLTPAAPAPA